jgi:GTPase SAR1 family protein
MPAEEEVPAAAAAAPAEGPPAEKKDLFAHIADTVAKADVPAAADGELIFVGAKGSGKSSIVQAFLQKEEVPKPSTPLEFRYARRATASGTMVADVWELGGGVTGQKQLSELLKVVLQPELLSRSVVAIVLDLSEPETALPTLLRWLSELRSRVTACQQELAKTAEGSAIAAAARKATGATWAEHPDADVAAIEAVAPIGVPVVVVAHKYDAFETAYTEGEHRKVLCRTLRYLSHQAGASLVCTKNKDKQVLTRVHDSPHAHGADGAHTAHTAWVTPTWHEPRRPLAAAPSRSLSLSHTHLPTTSILIYTTPSFRVLHRVQSMTILRNMLYSHVFGTSPIDGRLLQLDHNRALVVPVTSDSFKSIGKAPTVQGCLSDLNADKWRAVYEEYFPPPRDKAGEKQDLSMVEAEQFAEEAIDTLRRQKREELVKMRKAAEFEAKMQEAGAASTATT